MLEKNGCQFIAKKLHYKEENTDFNSKQNKSVTEYANSGKQVNMQTQTQT